jgi:hypothetical protein
MHEDDGHTGCGDHRGHVDISAQRTDIVDRGS